MASFRAAEQVLARVRRRGTDNAMEPLRSGGRGKGKKGNNNTVIIQRNALEGDLEVIQRPVRAYSAKHQHWLKVQVGRQVARTTVVNESHTGDTDRPPDGNIGVHCTPTTT